jgi:hypothetical protein
MQGNWLPQSAAEDFLRGVQQTKNRRDIQTCFCKARAVPSPDLNTTETCRLPHSSGGNSIGDQKRDVALALACGVSVLARNETPPARVRSTARYWNYHDSKGLAKVGKSQCPIQEYRAAGAALPVGSCPYLAVK